MVKCPKCKTEIPCLLDKKMTLIYSFYLAIAGVAFFIFINGLYTTFQAKIWQYSERYMTNSVTLTIVPLFAGLLLLLTCFWILKNKKNAKITGIIGCLFLIIYPIYVTILDIEMPYSFNYILIMLVPAIVLLMVTLFFWKKS